MLNNNFDKFVLSLTIILLGMIVFFAIIAANVWLFADFIKMVDVNVYPILGAIEVVILDVACIIFCIKHADEITAPDDVE